jgi:hypothetical protein
MNHSRRRLFSVGGWKLWIPMALLAPASLPLAQTPSCGLGPPPGSAAFARHEQAQDEQRRSLGYVLVCEENLRRFDYASMAKPLNEAARRLAFTPVPLDSTPFKDFEALGGRPDIVVGDAGPAALHRTFRTPRGHIVDLREWDMSVGGGQIMARTDLQTEQVNGTPAQLTVLQAPSGKAVSLLRWIEGRRSYELSISANVKTSSLSPTLLQLANSIPKSVPARLREAESNFRFPPPPQPPTFR